MIPELPGRRVTRLAKVMVDVTWWFVLAGTALVAGLIILFVVADIEPTFSVHVSIPDSAAVRLMPLTSADTLVAAQPVLEAVEANLHFRVREGWFQLLGVLWLLPLLSAVLIGLALLRSFLADVRAAHVFTAANARRLSWLGWLLVVAGIAWPVLDFGYTSILLRHARLAGVPMETGTIHMGPALMGVLVLVLAAAWRYGVELQRDRDLTV
jgi:hypothetical protein